MTFFQDMTQAIESYADDHLELAIIDVSFPGTVLNTSEEGSFKVQVTNRGPLILTDVTVKVRGVNGTLVRSGGAIAQWAAEFVTGANQLPRLNAHNGNNPQVIGGSPFRFQAPGSQQQASDLIEVTLEDWNANTSHIMDAHSDPVDSPKGTFAAEVVPA